MNKGIPAKLYTEIAGGIFSKEVSVMSKVS
jgi:hypothetical protein